MKSLAELLRIEPDDSLHVRQFKQEIGFIAAHFEREKDFLERAAACEDMIDEYRANKWGGGFSEWKARKLAIAREFAEFTIRWRKMFGALSRKRHGEEPAWLWDLP